MQDTTLAPEAAVDAAAFVLAHASDHVADIVERLNHLQPDAVAAVLEQLPFERAVEVLDEPSLAAAAEAMVLLPLSLAARLLPAMAEDRAVDVLRELEEPQRTRLLARIPTAARHSILNLLGHSPHTAGGLMTTEFVSVPDDFTVGEALEHIRRVERTRETVYAIYVLDRKTERLLQAVSLRRLTIANPGDPIPVLSGMRFNPQKCNPRVVLQLYVGRALGRHGAMYRRVPNFHFDVRDCEACHLELESVVRDRPS